MLQRRLAARLAVLGNPEPNLYLQRLRSEPAECDRLIEATSINVTSFFRNPAMWEFLAQTVLPATIERKQRGRGREFRAWSAGCASGEEAYGVAILLHEALSDELENWKVHIFATDLSEQALKTAARGVYPRERMEYTRLGRIDQYFRQSAGTYEVRPILRRMVWFSRDDLTSQRVAPAESIYGSFDLVLCRNVLIYFDQALQKRVFEKLSRAIAPGGYLVLGESELLDKDNEFGLKVMDRRNRIYFKPLEAASPRSATTRAGEPSHA